MNKEEHPKEQRQKLKNKERGLEDRTTKIINWKLNQESSLQVLVDKGISSYTKQPVGRVKYSFSKCVII